MTTVTVNGVFAEVEGEGFPVVMIHGLGGTSNTFQPQMEALRSNRVIRVDLPGSGRSAARPGTPTMAAIRRGGARRSSVFSASAARISSAIRWARSSARRSPPTGRIWSRR